MSLPRRSLQTDTCVHHFYISSRVIQQQSLCMQKNFHTSPFLVSIGMVISCDCVRRFAITNSFLNILNIVLDMSICVGNSTKYMH